MAEYAVILERTVTEEGYVMVEAESVVEAESKAEKLPVNDISWERVKDGKHWATSIEEDPDKPIEESQE